LKKDSGPWSELHSLNTVTITVSLYRSFNYVWRFIDLAVA